MARTKKKSVREMRAELSRLEREIQMKEQEEALVQVTGSREFKSVARKLNGLGLSASEIGELFSDKPKRKRIAKKASTGKKRGKVKPKYRHPKKKSLTWTGRGMQPRWVRAALEEGMKIEDLLIKESGSRKG